MVVVWHLQQLVVASPSHQCHHCLTHHQASTAETHHEEARLLLSKFLRIVEQTGTIIWHQELRIAARTEKT